MKIVFLHPNLTQMAGTERVIIDKINYLAEKSGYEIVILTYEHGGHPIAYPISPKVTHIDLNICFYQLYNYNRLFRLYNKSKLTKKLQKKFDAFVIKFKPDIIVTVTYYVEALKTIARCPYQAVRMLESHVDKRFLLSNDPTVKQDFITQMRLFYENWGVNHYAKQFDLLVALTQADANNWSKYLNTRVITNMVHVNKGTYHSNLQNKRVIFAGRYSPEKGIDDLFKIWAIVYQKHPDWQLDLYGTGTLYDELNAKAKMINITIHNPTEDIFGKYMESSILVLSSIFEAFGLVIVEAMSCGLPVVSFDCPFGPRNIITEGHDGFLIPDRNIHAFANRICQLIESEGLRYKIGQNAIQTAKKYYPEVIIPQWVSLYEELTNQNKHEE